MWITFRDLLQRGSEPERDELPRARSSRPTRNGVIDEPTAILATGNETEFRRAARGITTG